MLQSTVSINVLHVCFGDFELDEPNARLSRDGKPIALAPRPFGVLCALLHKPGSLLTKHVLLDLVWGHRFVSDSVLKGAISDVRNALGDDPRHPRFIETVSRRGYRFVATPVAMNEAARPAPVAVSGESHAAAAPIATAVELPTSPFFIGRMAELTRLRRTWDRVGGGSRAIVWVAAEPGLGKTTLIEHFASTLGSEVCARGRCVQHHGSGEPYLPVLEAIADLCHRDAEAAALLRAVAPTWLLQLPWLSSPEEREALLHELVGANPQRMMRELGEFLDRCTERQPVMLVTEDLHWADASTIQLIDYLARRRSGARLMWIATFRLTEVIARGHPLNALRHELRLQGLCEEIVLSPFSESEVGAYLAHHAPVLAADERLVRDLHERTEGVPLFVASITGDVADQATRTGLAEASRRLRTKIPQSLTALIDHYATQLTDERRRLLVAAAVCGVEFRLGTLARALARDELELADACDELAHEQLWLDTVSADDARALAPSFSFRHGLFRQVLYERTAASARAELHRRIGTALETERAAGFAVTATELAMHFDHGHAPMAALRYYAEAAQAALLHLSPAECMSLTERALNLAPRAPAGPERSTLELTLAALRGVAAFHTLGAGDETSKAYSRASALLAEIPAHPMAGLVLHGLGFVQVLRAEYEEALATAERAEALAATRDDPLLTLASCTVQGQVLMSQGQPQAARAVLERALPAVECASATAEHNFLGFIADPQVTVWALLSLQLTHLGLLAQARVRLVQAYARAREIGQPVALMVTLWFDALCEIRRGDAARVRALAGEMQLLVDEFDLAQGRTACRWFRGWADSRSGHGLDGFRMIRAAYEENRALGMVSGSSETLGYAAEALLSHGDLEGAQEQLDQALDIAERYGERVYLPQLLLIQAEITRSSAGAAEAEKCIRSALAEASSNSAPWLVLLVLTDLCEHAPATQDRRTLAALVEQLGDARGAALLTRAEQLVGRTGPA
ncbi:MAG: AAA family ATPase [Pseudomonadota bacterium]|nr:AAA family ATPase [Pseudomonadota bacterium]